MSKFLNINFILAAALPLLASCSCMNKNASSAKASATAANPAADLYQPHQLTRAVQTEYLLYLPKGYDAKAAKRWPVILFLHGAGERGSNIWRAAIHGPTKFIEQHPEFPFIVITPHLPLGGKWSDNDVLAMLDDVIAHHAVDTNRIYLTGLSMGGYAAWSLATTYPERFAAVAPICGGEGNIGVVLSLGNKTKSPALKALPIWAFHGLKDHVVLEEESERMVKILQCAGNQNVKLTTYPDLDHNSWTITYANPELYDWFLQHSLPPTISK